MLCPTVVVERPEPPHQLINNTGHRYQLRNRITIVHHLYLDDNKLYAYSLTNPQVHKSLIYGKTKVQAINSYALLIIKFLAGIIKLAKGGNSYHKY